MTPLACNIGAFTAAERERYQTLTHNLIAKAVQRRELPDGYAFRIDASIADIAEWINYERRCCPFFHFHLEIPAGNGGVWLSLAGDAGVKEFIVSEFGGVLFRFSTLIRNGGMCKCLARTYLTLPWVWFSCS